MAEQTRRSGSDGLKDLLLSSVQSTGFWSFILAIVGVVAVASGGILYLTIEEIRDFAVSVLVIGLVLLFLALVLSPRAIAIFLVGRQGRYGSNVIVMTIAFFAIVVLVNFLLFRTPTRVDVTATRVFTLSEQTLQVLNNMDTMVRANAFFIPGDSRTVAARQQAEDLLNEFARRSPNFSYRFVDPELQRSVATQYNVTSYPTIVFENLEDGTRQAVPSFTEPDFLTGTLIVTGTDQKVVYYLTGHNEAAATRDPVSGSFNEIEGFDFAIEGMQRDNYRVRPLNLTNAGSVPEDAAVLVIANPKQDLGTQGVDEKAVLEEYIKGGGRVVALLEPNAPQSFIDLFSQWGVTLGGQSVADAVSNVAGEELTPLVQKANAQYFTSAMPSYEGINIADPLDVTVFPEATSIEPIMPPAEMPPYVRVRPLVRTTPASWLESNVEEVSFSPEEDRPGPFFLAAIVEASGTVDETERHEPAKIVLFGDSDFAKNGFFFSNDNANLFLNSVNWLAGDYGLVSIRPKLFPYRELVVTTRERDFIKWTSWFVPPTVMLMIGAVVWWRRR